MRLVLERTPKPQAQVMPSHGWSAGAAGIMAGALMIGLAAAYATALVVVVTGEVDADLIAPLLLTLVSAAFGRPAGFSLEPNPDLAGLGVDFVAMPWVAAAVLLPMLGGLLVRRRSVAEGSRALPTVAALAAGYALVIGVTTALVVANLNDVWESLRLGADVATLAGRALLAGALGGWIALRRRRPDAGARHSGRILSAMASGAGAFAVVVVIAGAVAMATAAADLPESEQLVVYAAAPLVLVNLGAMALSLVLGAPVVGGVASAVGAGLGTSPIDAVVVDRAFSTARASRSAAALLVLAVLFAVVVRAGWLLMRRFRIATVGEGLLLTATMAFGFAAMGWLVATQAAIDLEAFFFSARRATRPVLALAADVDTARIFPGLFVPALAAGAAAVGLTALRRRLPLNAHRAEHPPKTIRESAR